MAEVALELGPQVRVNGVEPADIARTVCFLACEAPFVTGQWMAAGG